MAKDPVCPIYYNDVLGSTRSWTDEEFGCYMRLLLEQWDKYFIPKEMFRLKKIADSVEKNWPLISPKFKDCPEGLQNEVMEGHREKREKFRKHQSDNGKNGGRPPKSETKPNLNPNETQTNTQTEAKKKPLEGEIEIEEETEIEEEKEKYPFGDFWNDYDKKVGLSKCEAKWPKVSEAEREEIRLYLPKYKESQPKKQFRKNPETFLNNKSWKDEIITNSELATKSTGNDQKQATARNLSNAAAEFLQGSAGKVLRTGN